MFKNLLTKLRDLTITSVLFTGCTYGYIYHRADKNNKRYV